MFKFLANLVYTLVGDPKRHSLEHRLFSTITLLFGFANLGGSLNYLDFDMYPVLLFVVHVVVGLIYLAFYYLSRVRSFYRALYWPLVVLMACFLFLSVVRDGASLGGTHYYLILATVVSTILARRIWEMVVAALLISAVTAFMFYIEIFEPEMITKYPGTEQERLTDLASQFIFIMFFTSLIVEVLSRNLDQERHKSERLLLNVLPESVADELKRTDRVQPRHYDGATVLFTDFVGFTRIAEGLTPQQLIEELDNCFRLFDQIMRDHNMEKIKTIGDAYMAVGGIPEANQSHAVDAVLAGLEIQRCMQGLAKAKSEAGQDFWELRLGIHSGELVAGVIGEEKFAYDVWGDTVNTASRLESTGERGRVNISGETYERVKTFFTCEHRGRIEAKNKGDIEMFFVTGIRPELRDEDGKPNDRFRAQYWKI